MIPLSLGSEPLHLLCIGAHADDIEIGAGGTVLRLAAEGRLHAVRWAVLSATAEREAEARTAAQRFLDGIEDAHVSVDHFRDGRFPGAWGELKDRLEEIARESTAELVLVPRRDDWHQDHRVIAELAWTVFRDQLILEYEIPKWDGDLVTPNVYVHLPESVLRRKVELLLECFPSQSGREWFGAETFNALARLRGVESRARDGYAEGFRGHKLVV